MNRAQKAILWQEKQKEKDREWWRRLRKLEKEKNITEFYAVYAEYLKWASIESESREILYRMAKLVSNSKLIPEE